MLRKSLSKMCFSTTYLGGKWVDGVMFCIFWTYKFPVRYILSSVWVRWSIFSQLSITHYGLCVSSLPISLAMIESIYILFRIIIIKSDLWTIIHYLELGHETMVCAACLYSFAFFAKHDECSCIENTITTSIFISQVEISKSGKQDSVNVTINGWYD